MKKLTFILSAFIATFFASCSDDTYESDNYSPQPQQVTQQVDQKKNANFEIADDVKAYQLIYNKFHSPNDVQIVTPDTVGITVDAELLKEINADIKPGNVVSIWRAKEEIPFMRRVQSVSNEGNTVKLQTCKVELCEVLKEAHLEFDTEVYQKSGVQSRCADGGVNDEYYRSDNDGVLHPVAIWYHSKEEGKQMLEQTSRAGGASIPVFGEDVRRTVVIDEQLPTSRGQVNLGIKVEPTLEDFTFPIVENGDTVASFGMQGAEFKFEGGLHARLDCSLWSGIKCLEVGPYYSLEGKMDVGLKVAKELAKKEKEIDLAQFSGVSTSFWVGPFPVVIEFAPSLYFGTSFQAKAEGFMGAKLSFSGDHHTYATYKDGRWGLDNNGKPFEFKAEPYLGGKLSAEFKAGVYLKGACKLYGCAGPKVSVGPYFKAKAEVERTVLDNNFKASAEASVGLGGEVGAEVKIWKWSLANWKTPFSIVESQILKKDFDLNEWLEQEKKSESFKPIK